MSLIQEALRRKDEDDGRIEPEASKVVSGPPPRESLVKKEQPRGSKAIFAILVLILVLLGAALALLFKMFGRIPETSSNMATVENAVIPVTGPGSGRPAEESRLASTSIILEVPPHLNGTKKPAPAEPLEMVAAPPSPVLTVDAALDEEEVVVTGVTEEAVVAEDDFEDDYVDDPARWPRLSLGGVISRGDPQSSAAILNGEIISVGEKIRGVMVVEVETGGVWLERFGERRFLRVGRVIK